MADPTQPDLGTLAERYRIIRRLGAGGMAKVFLAEDQMLGRTVAIKMLHGDLEGDEEVRKRFLREARIFARLKHPCIVDIYDIVTTPDGVAMVMEFIDGTDLARVIRGAGQLVPELAALVIRPVADALSYAHDQGVVHRDVKPANILMGKDGAVKVADFGIAKATEETHLTRTGDFLGTPAYIAPEQARGEKIGPAADQYALGAVLYELVTGSQPFKAPNTLAVLTKIMNGDYPDPRTLNDAVDAHLASIIARTLELDAEDRYPDIAALLGALQAYVHEVSRDRERRLLSDLVNDPSTASDNMAAEVADSLVVTGKKAYESGDMDQARAAAEGALARSPDHTAAQELLASLAELGIARPRPDAPSTEVVGARKGGTMILLVALVLTATLGVGIWRLLSKNPRASAPKVDGAVAAVVAQDAAPLLRDAAVIDAAPKPADAAPKPPDAAFKVAAKTPEPRPKARKSRKGRRPPRSKPPVPKPPEPRPEPPKPPPKNGPPKPPVAAPSAPGTLAIASAPWAEVYVDGKQRGRTPYLKEVSLKPGRHTLELRNPGLPPHKESITIVSGERLVRRVRLGGRR